MSRGIDAMMGIGSLCRHRISKTSSRNPSIVAISSERREDRYTDNLGGLDTYVSRMKGKDYSLT
jgi:hypothetical protein